MTPDKKRPNLDYPNEPAETRPIPGHRSQQTAPARLVLIPGLGANRRVYEPQLPVDPTLAVPTFPRNAGPRETLDDYCKRFAEHIHATLDLADSFHIGGISFGGMCALEMAPTLEPASVILIGACEQPTDISWQFRTVARLVSISPTLGAKLVLNSPLPRWSALWQTIRGENVDRLVTLAREMDIEFTKWAARACVGWGGASARGLTIGRVHGRNDHIIPNPPLGTTLVEGRHLINLSNPDAVNAFLSAWLAEQELQPAGHESALEIDQAGGR